MKRIFFNRDGGEVKPHYPFWQPWGCMGCLWRALLFLLGMVLIAILVALFSKGCCDGSGYLRDIHNQPLPIEGPVKKVPYDPITKLPPELTDTTRVGIWNDSIPGVKELPAPYKNIIPPVDSVKVKPDPVDSLTNIIADQIIVLFNSKDIKTDMSSFARMFKKVYPDASYSVIYYNPTAGTMLLQVPEQRLHDLLYEIPRRITGIDYKLTTNPMLYVEKIPSDPEFGEAEYDRYFKAVQAFDAWDITSGSEDVIVGIVDTYFCLDNPEINSRYIHPIHIPSKTRNVLPRSLPEPPFHNTNELDEFCSACHGTHVAGIAIGSHDNGTGAGGIAPKCKWIPISVGNDVPLIYIMEGILYAIYQGADVINVSMGISFPENVDQIVPLQEQARRTRETFHYQEDVWQFVYQTACDHNCIICRSAGNDNVIMGMDAAKRSPLVVKVEATSPAGTSRADFRHFGPVARQALDISTVSAPGEGILSSIAWGMFMPMDGTSQATPFVTGAVALMKSLDKSLTPVQVIDILRRSGKPLPNSNHIGPLIQIRDALQMVIDGEVSDALMVYEEVIDDHNKLLGRWIGTELQILSSGDTGETIEELQTIMEFHNTESGVVEFHGINTQKVYRAPLQVTWDDNMVNIHQQGNAICTSDSTDMIVHNDYICRPDAAGLMEVAVVQSDEVRFTFNMRKVE